MNGYISLGTAPGSTKKYTTPSGKWVPLTNKPATVRLTLNGGVDATYASANYLIWQGEIEAFVTPKDGTWGVVSDLKTILSTRGEIYFIDHYGNTCYGHVIGQLPEVYFTNLWDDASSHVNIPVKFIKSR